MGCRILQGDNTGDSQGAVLYCSNTMIAFGPVFNDRDQAQRFCEWLDQTDSDPRDDPRFLSAIELEGAYLCFLSESNDPEERSSVTSPAARKAIGRWRGYV